MKKKKIRLKAKYRMHISYAERLIFFLLVLFIFLFLGLDTIASSITYTDLKTLDYQENGKAKYKVYLKENDFYETDYLDEKMTYVTSLIDKIEINYLYDFKISDYTNIEIANEITGKLVITDETGTNLYYEKEYVLSVTQTDTITDKVYALNKIVTIDYDYYNNIANEFKSSYGVNTNSSFVVSLKLNKLSTYNSMNKSNVLSLTIPLSKKSISISIDSNEINNNGNLILEKSKVKIDIKNMIKGIAMFLISIVGAVKTFELIFMLNTKKTNYDKLLHKVLKEYDRLIVSTTSLPDLEKYNIIRINNFDELLDVRDNLKIPIMYYNVRDHEKCHFYILHETNLYILSLKSVDMEKTDEKI